MLPSGFKQSSFLLSYCKCFLFHHKELKFHSQQLVVLDEGEEIELQEKNNLAVISISLINKEEGRRKKYGLSADSVRVFHEKLLVLSESHESIKIYSPLSVCNTLACMQST